ncbi:MAG TPA: hypothetical protein VGW33_04685 [Terriglobia bacterium]|nr:hypothetical protein [Terriglobia bacterium]
MSPDTSDRDPITNQSLSLLLLISALLMVASLGWALYDEFYGLRPWKAYEQEFAVKYSAFLEKQKPKQEAAEKAIKTSPGYQALQAQADALQKSVEPQLRQLDEQAALVDQRLAVITLKYTDAHAHVTDMVWRIEHNSGSSKKSWQSDLTEFEKGPFKYQAVSLSDGRVNAESVDYEHLEDDFKALQAEKGELLVRKGDVLRPVSELRAKLQSYFKEHMDGLTATQIQGLIEKTRSMDIAIKQINLPDAGIIDRCESCHLGIREPLTITAKDMGGERAFVSHPDPDLLKIHDPDKFGCTPCHNGNGMQLDSVKQAHGEYEHWLAPLYHGSGLKGVSPGAYMEAGCQQCHASDMIVDHAPVLSAGKDLFQWRGCVGCHRFQKYDTAPEDLTAAAQTLDQNAKQRAQDLTDAAKANAAGDRAPDNATARKDYAQAEDLRLAVTKIDLETDQINRRVKFLQMDRKKVGPDLKEVRAKLRPEWIPVWLKNPHAFRPTTRMPRFRLDEDELPAVAAFIWQSGLDVKAPSQAPGDPAKGKVSFESRGCMACHAVGEGANAVGGWFGANLSRVGEKENYDYLVRWIHNPRERSAPYCPVEKRDLTAADYAKHNLPYVFDLDHSKCPNDGAELVVEQMTPMPNLRLSWEESRDIASYLMTLKEKDPSSYPAAPYLNDPKLKAQGREIVQRYGCAGCHEIAGLEDETRIGTELTAEGSKPLEQMDFALYIRQAKDDGWWTPKGFFEHKLTRPEMYDDGMLKAEGEELKMPDFFEPQNGDITKKWTPKDLPLESQQQIAELTTFLMGSVSPRYPSKYFHLPAGQQKDIQDGWWVVKKYNCMGCHQFTLDQSSVLMTLPQYQTPDGKGQLPPRLVTEGARVNPDWLARFLANPALSDNDTDRDGVRSYLKVRMPTFYFSPIEVRKLVRFFQALSAQPLPYIPQKLEPLSTEEIAMARALFTSKGAPCLKCHAVGLPAHDQYASAPNFLLAQDRLKPDWVTHWILDPALIDPGTAMPSGLFKQSDGHWVFNGPTPPIFKGYEGDQASLVMRYLFELTPSEQQKLIQMTGAGMSAVPAKSTSGLRREPASQASLSGMRRSAGR